MTTLKISVKNRRDANLLYRILVKLSFIEKIEKIDTEQVPNDQMQYSRLKNILIEQAGPNLFNEISDPVKWQKDLRNEWE